MASKAIIFGAVEGKLSSTFAKITKLQNKNAFSFAVVAGDLFADPSNSAPEDESNLTSLLNGQIEIPLPTYFTVGKHALPAQVIERLESSEGEICPNLFFLGKRSTIKTSEGIRIVALGGQLDSSVIAGLSKDKYLPFHTEGDAKALHGANSADILITTCWPALVRNGSRVPLPEGTEEPVSEQCIAELCATLRPRYHFSCTPDAFWEREPFYHLPTELKPDVKPITRFISVASLTSASKAKGLYAFSLDPNAPTPASPPSGSTPSPLTSIIRKRPLPDQASSFRYSTNNNHHPHSSHRSKRQRAPPGPSECFFCLSNPNLSTHLITSIASDTYATTAKGPLTLSDNFPTLDHPMHVLLIPLTHAPTLSMVSEESRASTYAELQRYRTALHTMLSAKAEGALGSVTWEISRGRNVHFHWQFLAAPKDLIKKGLVEAAFRVEAENEKYPAFRKRDIGDGCDSEGDYFRVWIWMPEAAAGNASGVGEAEQPDGDKDVEGNIEEQKVRMGTGNGEGAAEANGTLRPGIETQLVLSLPPDLRFDIQFGRRVMGKLLGLESRLDWRACQQTEEEEKAEAERFKEMFKPYDFSLEE